MKDTLRFRRYALGKCSELAFNALVAFASSNAEQRFRLARTVRAIQAIDSRSSGSLPQHTQKRIQAVLKCVQNADVPIHFRDEEPFDRAFYYIKKLHWSKRDKLTAELVEILVQVVNS